MWKNQSWTWNWIHAAASKLTIVAGLNLPSWRAIGRSLTIRGLGDISSSGLGALVYFRGTFLPSLIPAHPINGSCNELNLPSELRALTHSQFFIGTVSGVP